MTRLPHYRPHRPSGLSVYLNDLRERLVPAKPPSLLPPSVLPSLPPVPWRREVASSRLQRRLQHALKRDRAFFELVRRNRARLLNRPSWLSQHMTAKQVPQPAWRHGLVALIVGLSVGGATWMTLFVNERVTLTGVPYRVVHKFWQDPTARDAYFNGDSQALHARLDSLGVEEDMKAFYRDRFATEYELDRYIHQLMFNQTGYVGEAYNVNEVGQLNSRPY
jgi:hypothetical protein